MSASTLKKAVKICLLVELLLLIVTLYIKINHLPFAFNSVLNMIAMAGLAVTLFLSVYWFLFSLFSKDSASK